MRLPVPRKERWQPLRGGLLNLYFYDNEIFEYEDGRLILRGNNGSGKSRVLALQLPFLLDGETRPDRLEPDGDPHKRIEFHLLMNGRYPDRTGYTWLEFGRMTDDGPQFRTIGCGMHAVQGKGAPTKWFFLTKQRVGEQFALVGTGGAPLTRARLDDAVRGSGEVFDSAEKYRAAVDREFFALGHARYRALLDLLIALRKPQLSRNLEEERLSSALSEALPPVSTEVLADVAEAFRGLETERADLDASRAAVQATRTFLDGYRRYVGVAARRRAKEVRTAQSAFEGANRELRVAEAELEAGKGEAAAARTRRGETRNNALAADQTVRTLESSPEMRNAQALQAAHEAARASEKAAKTAAAAHERAADQVRAHQDRVATANQETQRRRQNAALRLKALSAEATAAELPRVVREGDRIGLDSVDVDAVTKVRKTIERELADRRQHLKALTPLRKEMDTRGEKQKRCGDEVERARLARDHEFHECASSRVKRDAARDRLLADYDRWRADVQVFSVPTADELQSDVEVWTDTGSGADSPIRRAIDHAFQTTAEVMAGSRTEILTRLTESTRNVDALQQEHDDLKAGRHREPPRRHVVSGGRDLRDGAPLWAVCDFRDEVAQAERAGYEAALEASGLLDSWVTPDGITIHQPDGELYLSASGRTLAQSLAAVLRPAVDHGNARVSALSNESIQRVLERIGDGECEEHTWIDREGRFAIGAVRGGWTKSAAEYVGHGAREEARRLRLIALEQELEAARWNVSQIEQELADHDARRRKLDAERASAPTDDELRAAIERVAQHESAFARASTAVTTAEEALDAAREAFCAAREALVEAATAMGLQDHIDRLDVLGEHLRDTENAAAQLWTSIEFLGVTISQTAQATSLLNQAAADLSRAEAELQQADADHAAAAAHAKALDKSIGRSVQETLAQLDAAKKSLEAARVEERRAEDALMAATNNVATLNERVTRLEVSVSERVGFRDLAAASLRDLVQTRVLAVLGDGFAVDLERTSTTAIVELARSIESLLSSVAHDETAWAKVQSDLNARFGELDGALGSHGYRPGLVDEAGVRVVRVPFRGSEMDIHELSRTLEDDINSRDRILAAREREIIESHLLGEISTHLHEQLRRAEELVARMNTEIENRPMSTGMKLRFTWTPHPEAPPGFAAVRPRLLATQGLWSADERRAVADFLQQQIEQVRAKRDSGTWREHLSEAFDYRQWHRFGIDRYQDKKWMALTRRTHGTGSGGEKAIALTLPQLAAAAAHYRSASHEAPRLILLDEAFVGVDNDMRGKCFELLGAFDLDFVMTSEREWGCYPVVPALAIYQLTTRPGIDAVHTTRLVWNGKQRIRDEQRD